MELWQLSLLGSASAELACPSGRVLRLERKAAGLLTYLALEVTVQRSRIASFLWPESREGTARNNLNQLLRKLRLATGEDLVPSSGNALSLTANLQVDAVQAREHYLLGQYQAFLAFPRPLLAMHEYDDCPEFGDWLEMERERWRKWECDATREESERLERAGAYNEALAYAARLLDLDLLSEDAWRRQIRLQYLRGDRAAALATFRRCQDVLRRELNVTPLPETELLAQEIDRGTLPRAGLAPVSIPLAVLHPSTLVGREQEWARMEEAWGRGQVIFISGEPGIGKTRLAQDFARSKGAVLLLEGRPGDVNQPYATAARNVRASLALRPDIPLEPWERQELARILPELQEDVTPPALTSDTDTLRFKQAMMNVSRRAMQGVAAFVTDDMQYFDDASYDAGAFMMSSAFPLGTPAGLPHFIDTFRSGELSPAMQASLQGLVDSSVAVLIELQPLSEEAATALLNETGVFDDASLPAAITRYAGGNPVFLLETLKHLIETQQLKSALPDRLPPTTRVGQLIGRRLSRLSTPALHAARAAAVLQRDFNVELVAEVLGAPLLSVVQAWEELEAAQIMRGERFSHDLVYETVAAGIPSAVRPVLHRSAARALARHARHPALIAYHWLEGGAPAEALPCLHRAAEDAKHAYLRREAAELYARAAAVQQHLHDDVGAAASLNARSELLASLGKVLAT